MPTDRIAAVFGISVALVVCVLQVRTERDVAMIILGGVIISAGLLLAGVNDE